jgi:hypothetical protein
MIIVIVVAVLALVAAGWWAYNKWFKGIELETYNNENYTLLVPVGYNKEEDNDFQEFKEPGDEDTQSEVMAYYAAFPEPITADQVSQFKDLLKSELEDAAKNNLANPNDKVEDLKITDVKYKGEDALQLTATVTRDGKKEGEVKLVAVINTNEIYMVGVGAHVSDPGVSKEMDNIINSFEKK